MISFQINYNRVVGVFLLIVIVFIIGCGNSFRSCHERCMDIEKLKIDPSCKVYATDGKYLEKNCEINLEQIIEYKEYCFDKCLEVNAGFSNP